MLVMLVRLIVPFLILRHPLLGGILCIVLDYVDFDLIRWFNPEFLDAYQSLDKWLDLYYLSFEAFVVYLWKNLTLKKAILGLFVYRVLGIILFQTTGNEVILFLFPNFFEVIFLYYLIFKGRWKAILGLGVIWKVYQEYYLHIVKPDNWFTHTWEFIRGLFI